MKKILVLFIFSILAVGAVGIIYIKSNPPLVINGYQSFEENAKLKLIEIENTGIRELQLQNILVNDKLPENAELIVSKAEQLKTGLLNDSNITYHGIKQIKLFPSRYIDRKAVGKLPQYYGLKIEDDKIQKISIHYKYLKIPFTLTVELRTNE